MTAGSAMGNPLAGGTHADAVRPLTGLTRRGERYRAEPVPARRALTRASVHNDSGRARAHGATPPAGFRLRRGAHRDTSWSPLIHEPQLRRLAQQILENFVSLDVVGLSHVLVPGGPGAEHLQHDPVVRVVLRLHEVHEDAPRLVHRVPAHRLQLRFRLPESVLPRFDGDDEEEWAFRLGHAGFLHLPTEAQRSLRRHPDPLVAADSHGPSFTDGGVGWRGPSGSLSSEGSCTATSSWRTRRWSVTNSWPSAASVRLKDR